MDGKLVMAFLSDILYHKGVINADEYEAILDIRTHRDLDTYMERMFRGDFNAYRKGEHYTSYAE